MGGRVGYRFHPTDVELIDHFLRHKMDGRDSLVDDDIRLVDLCHFEPWELPGFAVDHRSNDQVWYFFCKRELKYINGGRPRYKRSTKTGHWKPTGAERPIKAKATKKMIGSKRTMVFYSRDSPNKEVRTNWVIHEYLPQTVLPHQNDFVLCKLKEKADDKVDVSAGDEGESSYHNSNNRVTDRQLVDTPIQQVDFQHQFHIEEGISLDDLMFDDVFDNDAGESACPFDASEPLDTTNLAGPAFRFDTNEPEVEMADSFIVVRENQNGENYLCSIEDFDDLDSHIVYAAGQGPDIPNFNNGPASSNQYRQTRTVQTITETLPSSTYNRSGKEKNSFHADEMEVSHSSTDSTIKIKSRIAVDKPICVEPRSGNIKIEKEATKKTKILQGNFSDASEYKAREATEKVILRGPICTPPNENIKIKTEKELKMTNARTSLKLTDNAITGNNKTKSFIRWDMSPLSQRSLPPSVQAVNVVIGLILIIVVIWELLMLHG